MMREREFMPPYGAVFLRQVESCNSSVEMAPKIDFLRKGGRLFALLRKNAGLRLYDFMLPKLKIIKLRISGFKRIGFGSAFIS